MLPKKLHIEQIERFHKIHSELSDKIKCETDREKRGDLLMKYYEYIELWNKLDDFIEHTLKNQLDILNL